MEKQKAFSRIIAFLLLILTVALTMPLMFPLFNTTIINYSSTDSTLANIFFTSGNLVYLIAGIFYILFILLDLLLFTFLIVFSQDGKSSSGLVSTVKVFNLLSAMVNLVIGLYVCSLISFNIFTLALGGQILLITTVLQFILKFLFVIITPHERTEKAPKQPKPAKEPKVKKVREPKIKYYHSYEYITSIIACSIPFVYAIFLFTGILGKLTLWHFIGLGVTVLAFGYLIPILVIEIILRKKALNHYLSFFFQFSLWTMVGIDVALTIYGAITKISGLVFQIIGIVLMSAGILVCMYFTKRGDAMPAKEKKEKPAAQQPAPAPQPAAAPASPQPQYSQQPQQQYPQQQYPQQQQQYPQQQYPPQNNGGGGYGGGYY